MALNLKATLALDGSGFHAGARAVLSQAASLKNAIAGAFTGGVIATLTKKTIDYAGHINDLSDRLGVSTDFLQEFAYVAKQTGTDLEALTKIIEHMRETRDKALSGDKQALAGFAAFGITGGKLKSDFGEMITGPIAAGLEKSASQGKLGAAFQQIGGKAASQLIPAFTDGLKKGMEDARKSGAVMSEDMIVQIDKIGDQFTILNQRLVVAWGETVIKMITFLRKSTAGIGATAAAVGAGTAQWGIWDFIKLALPFGMMNVFRKPFDKEAATKAGIQSISDFDIQIEAERKWLEALLLQRKNRRKVTDVAPVHLPEREKTDALVSVGNFLGKGPQIINQIAETNNILRSHTPLLQRIAYRPPNSDFPGI